jgi:hypothetical protein
MARKRQSVKCSARCTDGRKCSAWAMIGQLVCATHGGRAPQALAAAEQRVIAGKALAAAVTLGLPVDITPHEALLEEVSRSAGAVRWLEARIREIDPAALTWGVAVKVTGKQAAGKADYSEHRAAPHPLLVVYQHERKHLADVCRIAVAVGVEERRVQIAERLGGIVADVLTAVLDDVRLTEEQQAVARESIPRRLRLLAGDLSTEGVT